MLDPAQRAGVLTQAGFLAAKSGPDQSSPILRGVFVREQMFCQPLPPPPASVDANPPELNTDDDHQGALRRPPQRSVVRGLPQADRPRRASASRTTTPPAPGARTENGKPVDATGELVGTDVDGKFDGAIELSQALVESKDVETCMANHWFHFAFGREKTATWIAARWRR